MCDAAGFELLEPLAHVVAEGAVLGDFLGVRADGLQVPPLEAVIEVGLGHAEGFVVVADLAALFQEVGEVVLIAAELLDGKAYLFRRIESVALPEQAALDQPGQDPGGLGLQLDAKVGVGPAFVLGSRLPVDEGQPERDDQQPLPEGEVLGDRMQWVRYVSIRFGRLVSTRKRCCGARAMPGPTQLAACDPNKKWATAIFSPNGEESVSSAYPAAGIVTNASGLALPVHHYAEYVLALEIRPQSDAEGNPVLTGSGMPLPLERIRRWKADPAGMRSLRTARNFIIFDASQRDEMPGEIFVIRMVLVLFLFSAAYAAVKSVGGS